MTGLQLLGSVLAAFLYPGFGQLYQYRGSQSPERLEMAFKIQFAMSACVLASFCGVGLFILPVIWFLGLCEAALWAMRQPPAPAK